MEKLYRVSKKRPGADRGSDHELLIAKFRPSIIREKHTKTIMRYHLIPIRMAII